jgi:hypothetical protein
MQWNKPPLAMELRRGLLLYGAEGHSQRMTLKRIRLFVASSHLSGALWKKGNA